MSYPTAKAGDKQAQAGWGEGVRPSAAAPKGDGFSKAKNINKHSPTHSFQSSSVVFRHPLSSSVK